MSTILPSHSDTHDNNVDDKDNVYVASGAENQKSLVSSNDTNVQHDAVKKNNQETESRHCQDDALTEKAPRIPLSAMVLNGNGNGDNIKGGRDVSPKAIDCNDIEMELSDDEEEEMEMDDGLAAAEQINQLDLDNIINQDGEHEEEGFTVHQHEHEHEHDDEDLGECDHCEQQREIIERMQIELINAQEDTKVQCNVV
jgi:hypothetical protein